VAATNESSARRHGPCWRQQCPTPLCRQYLRSRTPTVHMTLRWSAACAVSGFHRWCNDVNWWRHFRDSSQWMPESLWNSRRTPYSVTRDALHQLSGAHYRKLFSWLLQFFLSLGNLASDIPLFPGFLSFPCSLTSCLAPAPLKLRPNTVWRYTNVFYYFIIIIIMKTQLGLFQFKWLPVEIMVIRNLPVWNAARLLERDSELHGHYIYI